MNPIETLKAQHSHLEDLFHELSLSKEVATTAEILGELAHELIAHLALEERLLRRALFSAPREAGLWDDWERRLRVERVTLALGEIDPSAPSCAAKVASLQELFEDRIEHEETRLFPKLQRFVGQRPARERSSTRAGALSPERNIAVGG